jgi:hypothetical protein
VGLISLVMTLVIVGIGVYLVDRAPFIDPTIKLIIKWVVIALVILWLLTIFVGDVELPRYHRIP